MKVKYFIPMLLLIPAISWTGTTLVVVRAKPAPVPPYFTLIDSVVAGPQKKVQVAPDSITVNFNDALPPPLLLGIMVVDEATGNPLPQARQCTVGVIDNATINYLYKVPRRIRLTNPYTGDGLGICSVYVGRATIYQPEAKPAISEFKFFARDLGEAPAKPDTSFPVDSVMPGPPTKLLLLRPGESHRPGFREDYIFNNPYGGRAGPVIDPINAATHYVMMLHGTDSYWNTVPGSPDMCNIKWCGGAGIPPGPCYEPKESYNYPFDYKYGDTTIAIDTVIFWCQCLGEVCLYATGSALQPSACVCLQVEGAPPGPGEEGMIRIDPNPFGAPSLHPRNRTIPPGHCRITIRAVSIAGGKLRVSIFNHYGYKVREFKDEEILTENGRPYLRDLTARYWYIDWDGKNDKGLKVGNGVYHVCVEVTQVEKAGVWKEEVGVVW